MPQGRRLSLIILDSSAVLAVLRNETGANVVLESLPDGVICAINLGEVVQVQIREGKTREQAAAVINELQIPVVEVDADLAIYAAELRMKVLKQGISQADSICLALAKREGAVALTGDRKWLEVAEILGVEVRLIR